MEKHQAFSVLNHPKQQMQKTTAIQQETKQEIKPTQTTQTKPQTKKTKQNQKENPPKTKHSGFIP